MYCDLTSKIFLDPTLLLLTCTHVNYEIKIKKGKTVRTIIPYFGVDNIFISIKYKNEFRGIRKSGKPFPTAIGGDLQKDLKNMYIKISPKKLHLCGALTFEMGINAFNAILSHIEMSNNNYKHFILLDKKIQENTINWLLSVLKMDNGGIHMFDSEHFKNNLTNIPDDVDERSAIFFSVFTYDFPTYDKYLNRISQILNLEIFDNDNICYYELPKIENSYIITSIFNYKYPIKEKISLIKTCKYLSDRGYGVTFCNFMGPKALKVAIPTYMIKEEDDTDDENISEDIEDIDDINETAFKAHRFEIKQNGTVKQSSPSHLDVAYEIKQILYNDLKNFLHFE